MGVGVVSVGLVFVNWKSERRRSAHLLAEEKLLGGLTAEGGLGNFLVCGGGSGGRSFGVEMPTVRCLRLAIEVQCC